MSGEDGADRVAAGDIDVETPPYPTSKPEATTELAGQAVFIRPPGRAGMCTMSSDTLRMFKLGEPEKVLARRKGGAALPRLEGLADSAPLSPGASSPRGPPSRRAPIAGEADVAASNAEGSLERMRGRGGRPSPIVSPSSPADAAPTIDRSTSGLLPYRRTVLLAAPRAGRLLLLARAAPGAAGLLLTIEKASLAGSMAVEALRAGRTRTGRIGLSAVMASAATPESSTARVMGGPPLRLAAREMPMPMAPAASVTVPASTRVSAS